MVSKCTKIRIAKSRPKPAAISPEAKNLLSTKSYCHQNAARGAVPIESLGCPTQTVLCQSAPANAGNKRLDEFVCLQTHEEVYAKCRAEGIDRRRSSLYGGMSGTGRPSVADPRCARLYRRRRSAEAPGSQIQALTERRVAFQKVYAALEAAGRDVVYREKVFGKSTNGRPELAKLMKVLKPGDVVVVAKLDRLARSTRDLLNLPHEVDELGCGFIFLGESWCDTTSSGRILL